MCKALLERPLKRAFIGRSASGRKNRRVNPARALPLLAAVLMLALPGPSARAGNDHDRARAAVQAGEVLPLKAVLARLERDHPGQVLEVELEQEEGRWVYEIKLLQPDGRLVKLELDAATAQTLRRIERSQRASDRR